MNFWLGNHIEIIMIATIHQPHFIPWIGYFNKLLNSDLFIVLDDVQFRRRYYQNRTDILSTSGQKLKITIPIKGTSRNTIIKNIQLEVNEKWISRFFKTIEYTYKTSTYYSEVIELLAPIKELIKHNNLLKLNMELIFNILNYLEHPIKYCFSSQFNCPKDPTERLIHLCKETDCTTYIFGEGNGINYHNPSEFHNKEIKTVQQDFKANHPTYTQKSNNFISGLSIIDILFVEGNSTVKKLILNSWKYEE